MHFSNRNIFNSNISQQGISDMLHYYPFGMLMPEHSFSAIDDYRFGFNGKLRDDDIKGGNSYEFEYRIYDSRIGRFLSVDPLTSNYPFSSPYSYAMNRVIDGIDIEGLEYLNGNEARIEFRSGRIQLKTENFHNISLSVWNARNGNPSNWPSGNIGINKTLAVIQFQASNEIPGATPNLNPEPNEAEMSDAELPQSLKGQSESGIQSEGYNRQGRREVEQGNYMVNIPPSSKAKMAAKSSLVIDAINQGLESYVNWAQSDDASKVQEHYDIAMKVGADMKEALYKGLIPPQYQNLESISNIMNVVLQGVNNTKDKGIYDVGMKIYNTISQPYELYQQTAPEGCDNTMVKKTIITGKAQ